MKLLKTSLWAVLVALFSYCGCQPAHAQTPSTTSPTGATISWIAPGDDSLTGQAYSYTLQLKKSANTTWVKLLAGPIPSPSGQRDATRLSSLTPDTDYDFSVAACDESGNCGPALVVRFHTAPPPATDTTAPSAPGSPSIGGVIRPFDKLRPQERWTTWPAVSLAVVR